jgi:hypothetical protein
MGLTTFVMGLVERTDEVLERARDQVAETFLRGTLGARPNVPALATGAVAEALPPEAAPWTNAKSGTKSKVVRRD